VRFVLFPGRHHLLTRFQAGYLRPLVGDGADAGTVVFAVTSANHANTKRNPVPYDRREAAIERFAVLEGLRCLVVPVLDTAPTDLFAAVTVKNVAATTGIELTPANTVVACSTPEVAAMYAALGFPLAGVELDAEPEPERPWEVLLRCAAGDPTWRELAHPASLDVFDRYGLDAHVRAVVNDPVVGAEGGLTTTRDYRTYAEAFEEAAARKWATVREYVRPGRIVDIGCGAGAVLALADREPALRESDLIGIEVARHLYEECVHRKAQGGFTNPNVYFYQRNVLGGAVLPERSVATTLTFALTHEIWSYGSGRESLEAFVRAIFTHTAPGGVWLNSDVCGPDEPDREVLLRLETGDGANPDKPRDDLAGLSREEVSGYVAGLSTRARLDQFAVDWQFPFPYEPGSGGAVALRLADAMDFLTRKDYHDNWLSETHEKFCGMSWPAWRELLAAAGFTLEPASRAFRNEWLTEHRFAPVARLTDLSGAVLDWPVTHLLAVARRPLNA
jgi:SAM-dependent methyltransferase